MLLVILLNAAVWIVLIGLLIWGVSRLFTNRTSSTPRIEHGPTALGILRQRHARGEIDAVTYDKMRRRLEADELSAHATGYYVFEKGETSKRCRRASPAWRFQSTPVSSTMRSGRCWLPSCQPATPRPPRSSDMRPITNGVFYVLRSGCAWRYLPREYGAWQTVHYYFRQWRRDGTDAVGGACHSPARRPAARAAAGREATHNCHNRTARALAHPIAEMNRVAGTSLTEASTLRAISMPGPPAQTPIILPSATRLVYSPSCLVAASQRAYL